MRTGFLAAVAGLFAAAGLTLAQEHVSPRPGPGDSGWTAATGHGPGRAQPRPENSPPGSAGLARVTDDECGPGGDPGCQPACGPFGRMWVSVEYLHWWTRAMKAPPLVTTGPASATGPVIGAPGTVALIGGGDLEEHQSRPGVRFTFGGWLDACQTKGFEASYFCLGSRSTDSAIGSSGAPGSAFLGRPFFDTSTGAPGVEFLAVPGFASGAVNVGTDSKKLQGAEALGLCNLCCGCCYRLDLLVGPRWLQLDESVTITESTTILANPAAPLVFAGSGLPVVAGTRIVVSDRFATRNDFYGGQVGVRAMFYYGDFYVDLRGKVGLGVTRSTLDVTGSTSVTPPGGTTVTTPGGLYALPGNIGHYTRDEFSVVSELGIFGGYQVTSHLRAFVGYTFLYWSGVARPVDQIGGNLNSTFVPTSIAPPAGPPTPPLVIKDTAFWAHGLSVGVELRY